MRTIAEVAHKDGALVHVDAVQAAAKIDVSARDLGADLLTISGHKFHAPKDIGALMVCRGVDIMPLWSGVQVRIFPVGGSAFEVKAEGERASQSGVPSPFEIALQIGNDKGSVIATTGNHEN